MSVKKIFISHASKDEQIIKHLIDDLLVGSLAVKISDIFCTTTDGTKIESGDDWRESIKQTIEEANVTLLVITPNYKESEVCICEMGAAWVLSSKVIPLMVDPINYSTVGIVQQPKQVERLLDDKSLDRLRDIIQVNLKIDPKDIKSDRWTTKKIEFIQKVKKYLQACPFLPPLSRDEFESIIDQCNNFEKAVESLISEKTDLEALVEDLKQAKDAKEIKEIEKKYKKIDPMDEFNELCKKVNLKLSKVTSIVRGIVFVAYSGKNISIQYKGWEEQLDEAISKDYITDECQINWDTTVLMRGLHEALSELDSFLGDKEEDESFVEAYEEEFDAPLSLSNIDFWEEAFNLGISIS